MATTHTSIEDRALSLLGANVNPEAVAAALGVTPGRISQLLADEQFASQVIALRYENLQKHNERDEAYDKIEDKLIAKLDKAIPLMLRPGDILKAIQVVNNAKRRGQRSPESTANQSPIVSITMPTQIINQFVTNNNNQVIKAGEQDLLTIQSGTLLNRIEGKDSGQESKTNGNLIKQ